MMDKKYNIKEALNDKEYNIEEWSEHLENCEGCSLCEHILGYYGGCCICDKLKHKSNLNYDHPSGDYYCDNCIDQMPKKNTAEYHSCRCGYRGTRKEIELYYDHPTTTYYCEECVTQIPEKNTIDYLICGNCGDRYLVKEMTLYHENFEESIVCDTCVSESVINSRFEILDL